MKAQINIVENYRHTKKRMYYEVFLIIKIKYQKREFYLGAKLSREEANSLGREETKEIIKALIKEITPVTFDEINEFILAKEQRNGTV